MRTRPAEPLADAVADASAQSLTFDDVLQKLTPKDRQNAEKHVLACEALPDGVRHVAVWRRLVTALTRLAPHAVKLGANHSILFFVPDGQYKMQVFALHDPREEEIGVYCGDVIDEAVKSGVITAPRRPTAGDDAVGPQSYTIAGVDDTLSIERLDGSVDNLPPFCKHLVGWNRKAVHVRLKPDATEYQMAAVERLCALTAQRLRKSA